jgi:hypothetical protein
VAGWIGSACAVVLMAVGVAGIIGAGVLSGGWLILLGLFLLQAARHDAAPAPRVPERAGAGAPESDSDDRADTRRAA